MQARTIKYVDIFCDRNNANDLDLNRNFPDFFMENNATIQPETRAVMEWLASEQFVLSGNLHGGAAVVSIPYDNNGKLDLIYESLV